jgi:hypothetical protein
MVNERVDSKGGFHIIWLQQGSFPSCKKFSPIYKYTMLHVQCSEAIRPVLTAGDRKVEESVTMILAMIGSQNFWWATIVLSEPNFTK